MFATRLHRLTAVLLAVLYGLVGFSGESLHYLATDPLALWSSSPPGETIVFYHTHGPDYQGHFHRHAHDSQPSHAHALASAPGETETSEHHAAFKSERSIHEPHACPLLALVAALKLGHSNGCTTAVVQTFLVTPLYHRADLRESEVLRIRNARGPPGPFFA